MNHFYGNKRNYFWVVCAGLLSVLVAAGGCEPLRKKFIRQKKQDKELSGTIPILEPIDYPEKIHSPAGDYRQRYAMLQVWHRELVNTLEGAAGSKQGLYDLDQIVAQLQEMQKLLTPQKSAGLSAVIAQFESLKEGVRQSGPFQNKTNIKLNAESLGKQIREEYRFDKVKESLVK